LFIFGLSAGLTVGFLAGPCSGLTAGLIAGACCALTGAVSLAFHPTACPQPAAMGAVHHRPNLAWLAYAAKPC
jgi:hypothetical protein